MTEWNELEFEEVSRMECDHSYGEWDCKIYENRVKLPSVLDSMKGKESIQTELRGSFQTKEFMVSGEIQKQLTTKDSVMLKFNKKKKIKIFFK